jgi:quinol monooxygenase YgiN
VEKRRSLSIPDSENHLSENFGLSQNGKGDKHMVLATIRMMMSAKKFGEALKILRSMAEQSRVQPGCLSSQIYRNGQEDNVLMLEQLWSNEEDLERHLRSDEYRQVLLVLEMAMKQPEIRFDTILSSTGIETIEKARTRKDNGRQERT